MFAHRSDHRVIFTVQIPQHIQYLTRLVEFYDTACVDIRGQPFVTRQLFGHPAAKAGAAHGKVKHLTAHAHDRQPVIPVRCDVDIIGIPWQVAKYNFDLTLFGSVKPIAFDRTIPAFGEQDALAIRCKRDAIGKDKLAQDGCRFLGLKLPHNW